MARYFLLVVWKNGESEWLKEGDRRAVFQNYREAKKQRDFMMIGMEDEVQGINTVAVGKGEVA
jgi:hypothetical protein